MPKPIKKKAQKPTVEQDVSSALHKIKEQAQTRSKQIIKISAAIVVMAIVIIAFVANRKGNIKKAEELQYEGYKLYYSLGTGTPMPKSERLTKALENFGKAYDLKKSPVSQFYKASALYELNRHEDALNALKELNSRFPDDERFVPLGYYKSAMAKLKLGRKEEALKDLEVLYNYRMDSFKDMSLAESAKILEDLGRKDEAVKKYEQLTKEFPDSDIARDAQRRLSTLINSPSALPNPAAPYIPAATLGNAGGQAK